MEAKTSGLVQAIIIDGGVVTAEPLQDGRDGDGGLDGVEVDAGRGVTAD